MTRRHEEKGDETVAFRVPERIACWLRDRARVIEAKTGERTTPSSLMRQIVEDHLTQDQSANISDGNRMFANLSQPAIAEALETARTAIETALQQTGMLKATGQKRRATKRAVVFMVSRSSPVSA